MDQSVTAGRKRERSPEVAAPTSNWARLQAKLPRRNGGDVAAERSSTVATSVVASSAQAAATTAAAASEVAAPAVGSLASIQATIRGPFSPTAKLTPEEASVIALDCEMVGVGKDGVRSALAQVVVVDYFGRSIYSRYVKVAEAITDYRTAVSGIRPEHQRNATPFAIVQKEIEALTRGKLVVGHALRNDMKALLLSHPWRRTRDTALYKPFTRRSRGGHMKPRRLKHLVKQHLQMDIQTGEHAPEEDARAALALYKLFRRDWEASMAAATSDPAASNASGSTPRPSGKGLKSAK
jgi:RNA exonuclease 4